MLHLQVSSDTLPGNWIPQHRTPNCGDYQYITEATTNISHNPQLWGLPINIRFCLTSLFTSYSTSALVLPKWTSQEFCSQTVWHWKVNVSQISGKSIHNFWQYPDDKQKDRVTNSRRLSISLLHGGNKIIPKGFQLEGQSGRETLQCKTSCKRTKITTQCIAHITSTFNDSLNFIIHNCIQKLYIGVIKTDYKWPCRSDWTQVLKELIS